MDKLPQEILLTVFEYLPVKELFGQVIRVNRENSEILKCQYFLSRVFRILTGCLKEISQESELVMKLLRKTQKKSRNKPLDLLGFGTTGGVDDDLPQYWVSNLFQPNHSSYCSRIAAGFSCVSVLKSTQKSDYTKVQLKYRKIAAKIVRSNPILKNLITEQKNSKENLLPLEEALFLEAWHQNPVLIHTFALDYSEMTRQKVFQVLSETQFNLVKFRKDSQNVLIRHVDHGVVDEFPVMGFVKGIKISREGDYSCPGSCFWVFASEDYVELCKENFHLFETVKSLQDLEVLCNNEGIFEIDQVFKDEQMEYCLFKRNCSNLKPLIWFHFLQESTLEAEVLLNHQVSGKYFYVTFTDIHNRMQAMHDPNNDPNVDFTFIVPFGFESFIK